MNIKTLQYWHKLEHFYPYIIQAQKDTNIKSYLFGETTQFIDFANQKPETDRIVRQYCVYLGIFKVDSALSALEEGMQINMRFRDTGDDESCFCMFRLNPDGTIRPETFQVSAFPWAIHRVRDGKIDIDQWDEHFLQFQKDLLSCLESHEGPVDFKFLLELRNRFAQNVNWKIEYCDKWLRIDKIIGKASNKQTNNQEDESLEEDKEIQTENEATDELVKKNDLLNSFYVRDLERVIDGVKNGRYPESFQKFMEHKTSKNIDVEHSPEALFELMAPTNLPLGRWPSNYGARFMQQVDVNAFLTNDEKYQQSFFSVNGPPGTGKTTLLKDIIAAIITKRAEMMLSLSTPDCAFEPTCVGKIQYKNWENKIWKLNKEFRNFGIIVASNNNGAVENITHTLPARKELPQQYDCESNYYFADVSDRILGDGKTWALNAAALGNKKNRSKFIENFWPINEEKEEPTKFNLRSELKKSTKDFYIKLWEEAKELFSKSLSKVRAEYRLIEELYSQTRKLRTLKEQLSNTEQEIAELGTSLCDVTEQLSEMQSVLCQKKREQEMIEVEYNYIVSATPFFRIRKFLFPNSLIIKEINQKQIQLNAVNKDVNEISKNCDKLKVKVSEIENDITNKQEVVKDCNEKITILEVDLEKISREKGIAYRVDEFFDNCGAGEYGKYSPWGYQALNELREQLFLSALNLHRVFAEGSKHLYDNLDAFNKLMRNMLPESKAKEFSNDLLQSLFLIVPVVSTTFASVGSFLRYIKEGEIAYLFIDEAGQAVPQSAAGAIWRARKVIAVGDPFQIEPVVTLHDAVIEALGEYFGQEPALMNKCTSVQNLADFANCLGGRRQISESEDLWIGAPLIVHNRCQRQVFDIANKIAYSNKMTFDTKERSDAVCKWIDVKGNSQNGHYVQAQAEVAIELIVEAFKTFIQGEKENSKYPSLFVITPFRSARAGLIKYFRDELFKRLCSSGIDTNNKEIKSYIQSWLGDCVGTIHTFQGKEANTVLLCLGVDSNGKGNGAVNWASETPNILNVAVTRAKVKLYIIADCNVWRTKEYFKTAWEICEKTDATDFAKSMSNI